MSIELLLLLAFILLPLIQQLLRAAKERERGQPKQAGGLPPARRPAKPGPQHRSAVALPPAPAVPPSRIPSPVAAMKAPARKAPRSTAEALVPDPAGRRRAGRRAEIVTGFRTPRDLRRAIVLMTILGPCRALAQDGRGERAGD